MDLDRIDSINRINQPQRTPRAQSIFFDFLCVLCTLFEHIAGTIKGGASTYEEFWALKDVSFTVKKGETLGSIGENGSGKSTLLKIIAGVLTPDSGSVKVNGRIAPFLELGVGFQPDLTAEDNVRLYGAIMGMMKEEMENKFEEIFEFAELGRFRNMKLKNFSSGMYASLAFPTAGFPLIKSAGG